MRVLPEISYEKMGARIEGAKNLYDLNYLKHCLKLDLSRYHRHEAITLMREINGREFVLECVKITKAELS